MHTLHKFESFITLFPFLTQANKKILSYCLKIYSKFKYSLPYLKKIISKGGSYE